MWIKASGDLTEHMSQISTSVSTHFIAMGDQTALVDASVWSVREELWEKISALVETIDCVFITHAHFDHVGTIPFLREKSPELKLVSGRKTAELLSDKNFTEKLRAENIAAANACGEELSCSEDDWFKSLQIDVILSEGDSINLGDNVEVRLFETPGHTDDSCCFYFKQDLALAAGESLGQYSGREKITPSFGSSYEDALLTLQKINALDIKLLSLPHSGVLSGDLVTKYLTELPLEMERFRKGFQQQIDEGLLIEEIVATVSADWVEEGRLPEGPFSDAHKKLIEKMVKQSRVSTDEEEE